MLLVVKGADFSSLGLGNVYVINDYITAIGMTNNAKKTALRNFYFALESAKLLEKFDGMYLFFDGKDTSDKLNLLNPVDSAAARRIDFVGDSPALHTSTGYDPNQATPSLGIIQFPLTSLSNFHLHVWNSTSEASGGTVNKHLIAAQDNAGANNLFVVLQRNGNAYTRGAISTYNSFQFVSSAPGYDVTKTGLLSIARTGTQQNLYDGGVQIASQTSAVTFPLNGNSKLCLGAIGAYQEPNQGTDAKIFFCAFGATAWTSTDEVNLNNALVSLRTGLGL